MENTALKNWLDTKKRIGKLNTKAVESLGTQSTQKAAIEAWRNRPKNARKLTQKEFLKASTDYCEFNAYREGQRFEKFKARKAIFPINSRPWNKEKTYRNNRINHSECGIQWAKEKRRELIKKFFIENLDLYPSGDLYLTINTGKVSIYCETSKGDQYSSGCKYRKTDLGITINVQKKYLTLINSGLAVIDGLVNLSLSRRHWIKDCFVHKAIWLKKGRGFNWTTQSGYIARVDNLSFHATTAKKAVNGLHKKIQINRLATASIEEIIEKARKSTTVLTASDSYKAGNCKPGTLEFCQRYGIDIKDRLPLPLAADLLQTTNNTGLRNAMIVALARE